MNAEALQELNVFSDSERFTDADVRNHKLLRTMATQYVRTYRGDFDFLRQVREAVLGGREMSVATVRGVLNCMLGDYSVDWAQAIAEMKVVETVAPVLTLVPKPPPPVKLPSQILIKSRLKFDLVYSTQPRSNRVHRVDHKASGSWYHREAHQINHVVRSRCGMRWQSWRYYGDRPLSLHAITKGEIRAKIDDLYSAVKDEIGKTIFLDEEEYLYAREHTIPANYHHCPDCERKTS